MKRLYMSILLTSILAFTSTAYGSDYYRSRSYFGYGGHDSPYAYNTYRSYRGPEIYLKGYGRHYREDLYYIRHNHYKFRWYRPVGYYESPRFYLKGPSSPYPEIMDYIRHKPYKIIKDKPYIYRDGYRFKGYGSGRFYDSPRHGGHWRR